MFSPPHTCTHMLFVHNKVFVRNNHFTAFAQVVWMLLGEVAPGACLHFQSDMQRFAAAPDLHVPTLSPTLLANVLQPLMGYGAVAVRLRRFLELVEDGRNTVRIAHTPLCKCCVPCCSSPTPLLTTSTRYAKLNDLILSRGCAT